jgi:1,4-alpha-glucan branching enzyme
LPGYRVGVPAAGFWAEALNSDAAEFGGSGLTNGAGTVAEALPVHGRTHSLSLTLPPLGAAFLRPDVQ